MAIKIKRTLDLKNLDIDPAKLYRLIHGTDIPDTPWTGIFRLRQL